MSSRISKSIYIVLVAVLTLAGCGIQLRRNAEPEGMRPETQNEADVLSRGPAVDAISVPYGEAARAIKATGGLNAWKKTTQLQLDCVVTFYQPDGSFYLTEQSYKVYPWSNSIQISADEPQGAFAWQWSDGQFDVLKGAGQINAMSKAIPSCCFAEGVLNIITTPARFLDGSVEFAKQSDPVKIQGKWYYPIVRQNKDAAASISGAVFYQDRSNYLVDMIRLACTDSDAVAGQSVQYVRGYDYEAAEKGIPSVPTRIEIFETDARDRSQKRLVQIDCHAVKRIN